MINETITLSIEDHNRRPAQCEATISLHRETAVILLSDLPNNPGMSVTNAAELYAAEMVRRYDLDPHRCLWIEHYPESACCPEATYDLITFHWSTRAGKHIAWRPEWRHVTAVFVQELLGTQ